MKCQIRNCNREAFTVIRYIALKGNKGADGLDAPLAVETEQNPSPFYFCEFHASPIYSVLRFITLE